MNTTLRYNRQMDLDYKNDTQHLCIYDSPDNRVVIEFGIGGPSLSITYAQVDALSLGLSTFLKTTKTPLTSAGE